MGQDELRERIRLVKTKTKNPFGVNVPVIAAGGIADSRGFVAALALGAQGVQIGTRFAVTYKAQGHPNFKNAILNVKNTGTVITGRAVGPTRCEPNRLTVQILKAE
jgi:enoyl-[acyl-carrier protein] reductase II